MTQRALIIDDRARRRVGKVVRHAMKRENWYNPRAPGWLNRIPGHDTRHKVYLDDFRCVFSYTIDSANNRVVRHLSISVPSDKYPHPAAVKTIAKLFRFTGDINLAEEDSFFSFPSDWEIAVKNDGPIDDHCIVVGQDTGIKP